MTDITELAQSHELLIANGQQTADLLRHLADNEIDSDYFAVVSECESYGKETDAELSITEFALRASVYVDALVEALEKAQGMEAHWKTQCRGIADHCEELQVRIAELEESNAQVIQLRDHYKRMTEEGLKQLAEARMALAAMGSSESVELPLDYLQGHKDGLEWASQLAEANHPETGDWLYDDPIELAKAIRKGPDMPPSQPALDTKPVAYTDERNLGYIDRGRETAYLWGKQNSEASDVALYRHAQPVPVVPNEIKHRIGGLDWGWEGEFNRGWNACRAAMLQELKKSAGTEAICRSDENVQVLHTKSPAQSDCCPAQNHVSPEQNGDTPAQSQGWIPVSERMPEIGDIVLTAMGGVVNVGEMECSAANCRFFTSVISGRELPATHWMPLPAAPQEVKGE
nr:DUF551 domain-containing protein [Klebsiella pneumoniae]